MSEPIERIGMRVAGVRRQTAAIRCFDLVDEQGSPLPPFSPGAHIDVFLPSGLIRQYSLCNDPAERHRYCVAVLRERAGRGGSAEMHDHVAEGDLIDITAPRNNFPLSADAAHHLLIAGGIGITPILSMIRALDNQGADWSLHYCTRRPEDTAFRDFLAGPDFAGRVTFHHDGGDPSAGLDVGALLADPAAGTHVYCCGPIGLMNAVRDSGAHWPTGTLHFEHFSAGEAAPSAEPNASFEVEIASTGQVVRIPHDKSILRTLEDNGIDVPHMCTEGVCGTCLVDVLDGVPDHRDFVLDDDEKASNRMITVCCSRAKSPKLKLDL